MKRQETVLYNRLMKICALDTESAKFFYKDFVSSMGTKMRVFSYHIASYTDWLQPGALECRGIMYEMDQDDKPVRIACRPMQKFFNYAENPFTMDIDLSDIDQITSKEDGSLVSSFIDNGYLFMKSKTSLFSDQAMTASSILSMEEHAPLRDRVKELAENGYTCNFEFVSPYNRIVLPYDAPALILLNVRNNVTGDYVPTEEIVKDAVLRKYLVASFAVDVDADTWVDDVRKQTGIEGFVVRLKSGLWFKIKTDWYCSLHHTKDSITSNKRLFEVVASQGADDLRGMFSTDQPALDKIDAFENAFMWALEKEFSVVVSVYNQLAGKDRREYALKAQEILGNQDMRHLFGIVMRQYNGLDSEAVIKSITELFHKNYEWYVPEQYK